MAAPLDRSIVQISDWPGLQTNTGPMASADPGSTVEQVNLRAIVTGELAARSGIRRVLFDEED